MRKVVEVAGWAVYINTDLMAELVEGADSVSSVQREGGSSKNEIL